MLELVAQSYNRTSRERLIAVGRLVLSSFSLLAVYLDPSEPARYANVAYSLLSVYVVYAAGVTVLLQFLPSAPIWLLVVTHAIDLGIFFVLSYFTEGPTSPFFVFFVFALLCATIRWQWRGVFCTGLVGVVGFIVMGVYTANVLQDPAFELNRFVIRGAYLAVLVAVLGYLGTDRLRLQRRLAELVAWPASLANEEVKFFREILRSCVATIGTQRAILVWEEKGEGSRYTAGLINGEFQWIRAPWLASKSLVADPLTATSFLCNALRRPRPRVVHTSPDGFALWRGEPLNREFQSRFAINATVLSSAVRGEYVEGRLFFFGKRGMSADDLMLAEIVSHLIATRIDNWYLVKQLQEAAAREERVQLANSLHSSVFQSLAAAGLQMEIIGQLLQRDPEGVKEWLTKAQECLRDGTRDMRSIVTALKRNAPAGNTGEAGQEHRVPVPHSRP